MCTAEGPSLKRGPSQHTLPPRLMPWWPMLAQVLCAPRSPPAARMLGAAAPGTGGLPPPQLQAQFTLSHAMTGTFALLVSRSKEMECTARRGWRDARSQHGQRGGHRVCGAEAHALIASSLTRPTYFSCKRALFGVAVYSGDPSPAGSALLTCARAPPHHHPHNVTLVFAQPRSGLPPA